MAKLTDKEMQELEDLQWKVGNKKADANDPRLIELSNRLNEERGQAPMADGGVLNDKDNDGEVDSKKGTDSKSSSDDEGGISATPTHTVTGEAPGHDKGNRGVTTTKNFQK